MELSTEADERTMRRDIIVVDNFYADPRAVREFALKQEYYYPYESDADIASGRKKFTWMCSRFKRAEECPFKSSPDLISTLAEITGEEIDMDYWNAVFPTTEEGKAAPNHTKGKGSNRGCIWNCCFHCKPDNGQKLGDGVHNHVTDTWNSVGINGWAGIVYLAEDAPLSGGLKLWRNRDPARQFDWMTPAENWELIDDLGNVPNRLLLCRGNLPHSGAGGWGWSLETSRLYQTFFFRSRRPRLSQSVLVSL
jgi:hypothetical protein